MEKRRRRKAKKEWRREKLGSKREEGKRIDEEKESWR